MTGGFPSQTDSSAESVLASWSLHVFIKHKKWAHLLSVVYKSNKTWSITYWCLCGSNDRVLLMNSLWPSEATGHIDLCQHWLKAPNYCLNQNLIIEVLNVLTHWGRVTHICVSKLTIIGSDNGLSPDRRQTLIWNNAGLLLIGPLGTNFSEILIKILTFSFTKMRLKVSSAKRRPFCLGLNVLNQCWEKKIIWKCCLQNVCHFV